MLKKEVITLKSHANPSELKIKEYYLVLRLSVPSNALPSSPECAYYQRVAMHVCILHAICLDERVIMLILLSKEIWNFG